MSESLYELTGIFNQVADMIDGEEINPAIIDTLESLEMAIEEKADGYAKVMKNTEVTSNGIAEEIKRLQARKKALDNNVKNMKISLQNTMETIGKTKFKTVLFSFNIQKNQESVNFTDESLIPDKYQKVAITYDKSAIKSDIKENGLEIPGVEITQSQSLRIR